MTVKKAYVATVQLLIPVDTETEAADFVSEVLRDCGFLDWEYLRLGGQLLSGTSIIIDEPYEEGAWGSHA